MMTGRECFDRAMKLLIIDDVVDYEPYALAQLNALLQETFDVNNGLLLAANKKPLEVAPVMVSLDEQIPYEEPLVSRALPYGLAAKAYMDDDVGLSQQYQAWFVSYVNSCMVLLPGTVNDLYADDLVEDVEVVE